MYSKIERLRLADLLLRTPKHVFVYAIYNNVTERIYIGQSNDVAKRYIHHCRDLQQGKHSSKEMQSDFDRYGQDSFELYIVLETVSQIVPHPYRAGSSMNMASIMEYETMNKYDSTVSGYNLQDTKAKEYLRTKHDMLAEIERKKLASNIKRHRRGHRIWQK